MRVGGQPNVVEGSVGIVAGDKNRTAIKIARVLGGVSECIHRPRSIFCVRSKIMDARLAGRNRRISLLDGGGCVVRRMLLPESCQYSLPCVAGLMNSLGPGSLVLPL